MTAKNQDLANTAVRGTRVKIWAFAALTLLFVAVPVVILAAFRSNSPPIISQWMGVVAICSLIAAMFCMVRLNQLHTVLGSLPLSAAWPPSPRDRYVGFRVLVSETDSLLLRRSTAVPSQALAAVLLLVILIGSAWMAWRLVSQLTQPGGGPQSWMTAIAVVLPLIIVWRLSNKYYVFEFACTRDAGRGEPTLLVQQRLMFLKPRFLSIPASTITWIEIREVKQKGRMLVMVVHTTNHPPLVLGFEPFHERRLANLKHLATAMRSVLSMPERAPDTSSC